MATYEEEMLKKAQLENENGNQAQTARLGSTSTAQQTQAGLMQSAPSANVMSAQKYLDSLVKGESPNYQSGYAPQIKQLYDQVMNRGEFAYDVNKDPLYQLLRSQHINNGRLAMEDTIAQATGLSSGYGNSFAQAVGQQQFNQHMQQLTGYIPQLRAQEQQEWAAEGDALQNQLAMAQQMDAAEYDKFRNEVNDLWNNMQFDFQKEQGMLANRQYAFDQALSMLQMGLTPSAELMAMAGLTEADIRTIQSRNWRGSTGSGSGSESVTGVQPYNYPLLDAMSKGVFPSQKTLMDTGLNAAQYAALMHTANKAENKGAAAIVNANKAMGDTAQSKMQNMMINNALNAKDADRIMREIRMEMK